MLKYFKLLVNRKLYCIGLLVGLLTLSSFISFGQTKLGEIYSGIKAQEANFKLPSTTETVTVGSVIMNDIGAGEIDFEFSIPKYSNGNYFKPNPLYKPGDDPVKGRYVPNRGGLLTVVNVAHLNLRFEIKYWNHPNSKLIVQVGSKSDTVPNGATEIIVNDVSEIEPTFSIFAEGANGFNGKPISRLRVLGLMPIKIEWKIIGAGAITIPVLPLSIVYAPVADPQKKNEASTEITKSIGNTTRLSFMSEKSETYPVPSFFQDEVEMAKGMNGLGQILVKIPNPYTKAIGTALIVISSGMGDAKATETKSFSINQQRALEIVNTHSVTQTTIASQGGPGEGDLISYYYNARVIWYSENNVMRLAILGFDGFAQVTAAQLKRALINLRDKPHGTKDTSLHLDSLSISSLLALDIFVEKGASAELIAPRFTNISEGAVIIGGGQLEHIFTHKVSSTESSTNTTTVTNTEDDESGFLSFLGLGVTETKKVQVRISQSILNQKTETQTYSQKFKLVGDGKSTYACEVYFDVVFGAFAFRDVSKSNIGSSVSGIVLGKNGNPLSNTTVIVKRNDKTFSAKTDHQGKFHLMLPSSLTGVLKLSVLKKSFQFNFTGTPLENLNIKMY